MSDLPTTGDLVESGPRAALVLQSGSSFSQGHLEADAAGLRTHGGGNSAETKAMLSSTALDGWPRHGVASAITTRRLIQDSTIDLVRPILSCNNQPSIKIAE